jgi:hypothetical protein
MGNKDKKSSKEAEKSSKKEKKSHKEKKSKKDAKKKRSKSSKKHDDDGTGDDVGPTISSEDFFTKNEEFRAWLRLLKNTHFEDLSSDAAHKLFDEEFVRAYNKRKLPAMFYAPGGLPTEVREQATRTKHAWNFRVTDRDVQQQEQIASEVNRKTRVNTDNAWVHMAAPKADMPPPSSRGPTGPLLCGVSGGSSSSSSSSSGRALGGQERTSQPAAVRREMAEELLGGAIGGGSSGGCREAMLQKRQAAGQRLHAAARDREEGRDGLDVPEAVAFGSDGEDFVAARARLARGQEHRQARQADRASELLQREEERNAAFMANLGIDLSKGPIKIQPRQN